ncbi:hypothetical protein [Tolypothrix sp. NIES-4075]|nr:hypothetical protein [Tolypothrix sp. NIES-4075]
MSKALTLAIGQTLDRMGEPTIQQAALIRATMQGKRLGTYK